MASETDSKNTDSSILGFLIRLVASIAFPLVLIGAGLWFVVSGEQVGQALDSHAITVAQLMDVVLEDEIQGDSSSSLAIADPSSLDAALVATVEPVLGGPVQLRILRLDGTVIYSTAPGEVNQNMTLAEVDPSALQGSASGRMLDAVGDQSPVVYSLPVATDGRTVGVARLLIADDPVVGEAGDSADRLVYLFGGALLAMFVALVPLCFWSLGEVRRQFRKTRVLAMSDNLTGLANRTQFHQRLDEAIAGADRANDNVGLVVLDLDGFKAINDTGGHAAGDRLLRRVAAALGEATRRNEIACRLGGDEFAVIAPRIKSRQELVGLANRLHEQLDLNVDFSDGRRLRVTASLGLALFPDDAVDPDELVAIADVAMYGVKASRKAKLPPDARQRAASANV